jgi:hypothetical protein
MLKYPPCLLLSSFACRLILSEVSDLGILDYDNTLMTREPAGLHILNVAD